MNVDDLVKYYGCKSVLQLSKVIDRPTGVVKKEGDKGISYTTLWKWKKKGIPARTQAYYQAISEGKLKASL